MARRRVGRVRRAGWLLGLRSSWAGLRCALAGLVGCWLGHEAEQAEAACEAFILISFFVFFFFFLDSNSNLVFKFGF
jgi:hypothetical protein